MNYKILLIARAQPAGAVSEQRSCLLLNREKTDFAGEKNEMEIIDIAMMQPLSSKA